MRLKAALKSPRLTLEQVAILSGAPQLRWAQDAIHAWDFTTNQARWNGRTIRGLSATPNWTFTRASTGYAANAAGVLIPFASGELRRTDRGVLIEGARTNLCLQSQTFDNASWVSVRAQAFGSGSVVDATAAPDGTTTADFICENTATGSHGIYQITSSLTSGVTYATSYYVKPGGRTWCVIEPSASSPAATCYFNLSGAGSVGTQTNCTGSIQALANGWYRCAVVFTSAATGTKTFGIYAATADTVASYTGDGTSGLYLWGAQLEAASFASSYVPTTTGSVTRAADSLTVTGVTGLSYPLTLYAEFERAVDTGGRETFFQVRFDGNNRFSIGVEASDIAESEQLAAGATNNVTVPGAISAGVVTKIAARCALNDVRNARAGSLGGADTSATLPTDPSSINIGSGNAGQYSFGYLRRAAIFASAKADAQLQSLTAA